MYIYMHNILGISPFILLYKSVSCVPNDNIYSLIVMFSYQHFLKSLSYTKFCQRCLYLFLNCSIYCKAQW